MNIVVTGGSSGLGRSTVEFLLNEGHSVAMFDLDVKGAKDYDDKRFIKIDADVTKKETIEGALKKVVEKFGRIDAIVNCAGVASVGLMFHKKKEYEADEKEFLRVFKINVIGTFLVSKAYVDLYMQHKWGKGCIINVSSIAASEGQNGQVAYSASKGAINSMTLPMARELGKHNIRVVTIMPGPIMTEMVQMLPEKALTNLNNSALLGKIGEPINFAHFVNAILNNDFINGGNLRLDGGIRAPKL